jgi:putative ABC transport system permease protein
MTGQPMPPRWADRFLAWYCNPELLEEIQGDAHELYFERLRTEGRRAANFKYIWDVIRFLRMSNVRRTEEFNEPGMFGIFWNLNMKIAIRNSMRNKTVFFVKLSALAICLAFTFLLTGFVINEFSYDRHHENYDRIYRIGTRADMQGKISKYAVSPLPTGYALADELPVVERASRFMYSHAVFNVEGERFFGVHSYAADSNFLRMFTHEYIQGSPSALGEPNRIVVTESIAKRLFGETHVMGRDIDLGWTKVEVTAVIRDLPLNTHMTFQALISWDTFQRQDTWDNINAYTYIMTTPGADRGQLYNEIRSTVSDYIKLIAEAYEMKYEPIVQRVDEIHLGGFLDEDFAPKRSINYVYIIISVMILFVLTGVFNYLNLALAELTTQIKKIAILRTFGGVSADHRKVAITDSILCLLIVAPVVVIIMVLVLSYPGLLPAIDTSSWTSPAFLGFTGGLILVILLCSSLNSIVISKNELMLASLKGKSTGAQKGFTVRKLLVAAQLSFSIVMIGLITVIFDQVQFVNESDKGFDDHDVIVLTRMGRYEQVKVLEERIRQLSGVVSVGGSSFYPDGGVETKDIFALETDEGFKQQLVKFIYCDKDYPQLLDLQLVEGRLFDDAHSTDIGGGAYIINETAAREFGWSDPIGKQIEGSINSNGPGKVIGVVKDFHFESMHTRIEPLVIFMTNNDWGAEFIYVRTEPLQSATLVPMIEKAYREVFPDIVFDFGYLDARYRGLYQHDYEIRDIFRWGLIISIIVSGLGIFSISALLLSLRTKEMGIRKVVGAENWDLFLRHLKPFVGFFLMALVIGLPVIMYLAGQWLNNFAYHIEIGAVYFILPGLMTAGIILGASVYHGIRSARVNPVDILKSE